MNEYDTGPLRISGSTDDESRTEPAETSSSSPARLGTDEPAADVTDRSPLIADGGEVILDSQEIQDTDEELREYTADGTLYAYRDGDEHVVVLRANDPSGEWTKRVPATRIDVSPGESLWTIPDNWELKFRAGEPSGTKYAVYTIPETGLNVGVTVPTNSRLLDATYYIDTVGDLDFEFKGTWNRSPLQKITGAFDSDAGSTAVLEALSTVDEKWKTFRREYIDEVEWWSVSVVWRLHPSGEGDTADKWSMHLSTDPFDVTEVVMNVCNVDEEIASDAAEVLSAAGVLPAEPEVRMKVGDLQVH